MLRRTIPLALMVVLLFSVMTAAAADDAGKPIGKWERSAGDTKILFDIMADGMKVTITDSAGNSIKVDATYAIKDGVLSGEVKKVEKVGVDAGPNEGDKFSFKFKVEKDKMSISDLDTAGGEEAKTLVQGEYQKK